MRCAVVGAGAWGTALADLLARNDHRVTLWAYEPDVVDAINEKHENVRFLAGHKLAPSLSAVGDLQKTVASAELIVLATPSQVLRPVLRSARASVRASAPLVIATKGLERQTLALMTDVAVEEIPGVTVVALSGPSFAAEVVQGQPTAVVVASESSEAAEIAQLAFSSPYFRAYTHTDVIGVELGGALKNIIAIAAGVVEGLGLGHNAKAALMTRGLAELSRLAVALGAQRDTLAGLAGLGDLVLTCTGDLSRNRRLGLALAKGQSLEQILAGTRMVAEGVRTTEAALALSAKHGIELPIAREMSDVLSGRTDPQTAIRNLMGRKQKLEHA